MHKKKKIIGICASATRHSNNLSIVKFIAEKTSAIFDFEIIDDLTQFPHFKADLTENNIPDKVAKFRNKITNAEGVVICSPEYVFSIPSGLKNLIEWSVSSTVFSEKPVALIVASANGEKGLDELKLLMKTIQAQFTEETTLLIQGVKGKMSLQGKITDAKTKIELNELLVAFQKAVNQSNS